MKTIALILGILARSNADEYFTGDGTTYTLGETSAGNCNMMSALNFAGTDYAALNNEQWDGLQNCGRCAEVSCADDRCTDQSKSIVVQILDRCPECKHGDLDLSPSVFTALTGSTPSRYHIKWKFVDCPVSGNVNYCLKGGSNNYWMGIQPTNCATGVKSLTINGQSTTMLGSAYYYLLDGASKTQTDLTHLTISVTDVNGNSIEDTVSLTADSCTEGTYQFPSGIALSPTIEQYTPSSKPTYEPPTQAPWTSPPTLAPWTSPPTLAPTAPPAEAPTVPPSQPPTYYTPPTDTPAPFIQEPLPPTVRPTIPTPDPATSTPCPQPEISPVAVPLSPVETPTTYPPPTTNPTTTDVPTAPAAPIVYDSTTFAPVTFAPENSIPKEWNPAFKVSGSFQLGKKSGFAAPPSTSTDDAYLFDNKPTQSTTDVSTPTAEAPYTGMEQTEQIEQNDDDQGAQTVSTQTKASSGGTDPLIIMLSTLGAVGVVALIVVVVMVRRRNIREEKARDVETQSLSSVQSFGVQQTPSDRRQALVGIL
ncbi:carbohydrate-binding protein, putative [Plasmopara halstedii]|uniref:Carbohydrate-binding protein, putative n=1 Tax=Plasmopara halstedii TaxID=4781 RepID=A0A0P1B5T7_PLAHL|nr:carbohydrate-binding protein, putative [Plasmopara halstedii]CEG50173.1 carbohydrate-binding protein, putative [Plasmopara halstedii]|eukprot:XP_024586542.1 carbohydrate-binding protein, putative [Plasmopara halstedii]